MEDKVSGLHHVTAIAGNPQQNYDFYTKILGLRMVKKTVNFDDPGTYHFYYGNEYGTPGSILTFFPWPRVKKGSTGSGMATETGFSVPDSSLEFWKERFDDHNVIHGEISKRFRESYLPFEDPDGLHLELVIPEVPDERKGWTTEEVNSDVAVKGFYNVTLTLNKMEPTADVLTGILGYSFHSREGNRHRFISDSPAGAGVVDLLTLPDAPPAVNAGGTNHHIAFRVRDEEVLMRFREKIIQRGMQITPKIDRNYFFSLYFREPGGVLFELATDNPGFTVDEEHDKLGSSLMLPKEYEGSRAKIEKALPRLRS